MLNKCSEVNLDTTVKMLTGNELGILLLEADDFNMYDVLAEKVTYKDRLSMFGNEIHITYHLFPLLYNNSDTIITNNLIEIRGIALRNIFERWNQLGYNKRHAKNMFNCKSFMKYLDDIHFNQADYMLLMVD